MKLPTVTWHAKRRNQRGAVVVEFALVGSIAMVMMVGIFEFGRLMYTWNSAVEATRRGARLAVVCDLSVAQIKTAMMKMLPVVNTGDISITYLPSGCTVNNCETVTVEILPGAQSSLATSYFLPGLKGLLPAISKTTWTIPKFSTTLTRESLQNGTGLDANPACTAGGPLE